MAVTLVSNAGFQGGCHEVLVTNWRITSRGGGGGGAAGISSASSGSIVTPEEWMPCQHIMCSLNEIHQWYMNITNLLQLP